jgi:hypothetical protein
MGIENPSILGGATGTQGTSESRTNGDDRILISDYFNEDDPLLLSDLFIEFECFSSVANKPHTRRVLLGKPLISLPRHQFWDF